MLGFQISPPERLEDARARVDALLATSRESPDYGLQASDFIDPTHLGEQLPDADHKCGTENSC